MLEQNEKLKIATNSSEEDFREIIEELEMNKLVIEKLKRKLAENSEINNSSSNVNQPPKKVAQATKSSLIAFDVFDVNSGGFRLAAYFIEKVSFEIEIVNQKGLRIYEEKFETDLLNLSMGFANLPKGDYWVVLTTKDGEFRKELNQII